MHHRQITLYEDSKHLTIGHPVTFTESISTCLTKYIDFTGRASRSEYWWWVLFSCIMNLVLSSISQNLAAVYAIAAFLPYLAVGARRLHDTNRSGWLQLLVLVPILGWILLIVLFVQDGKEPNKY